MAHVLIVDDDKDILDLLGRFLRQHGQQVSTAANAADMQKVLAAASDIDLVVLDIMLEGDDGLTVCRELRAASSVPVILLTAMSTPTDRIVGLEIGADDYVTKPFDPRELLARIKAVLRRSAERATVPKKGQTRPILCFGDWRLDIARRELRSSDNTLIVLSGSEFDLLLAFAEHPQRVLTRDQLIDLARGSTHLAYDRSIDVKVSRIRSKLEKDPKSPALIRTVRNGGYMFATAVMQRSQ